MLSMKMSSKDMERNNSNFLFLDLHGVKNRSVEDLSGGELQRFAIAIVCIQKGDM